MKKVKKLLIALLTISSSIFSVFILQFALSNNENNAMHKAYASINRGSGNDTCGKLIVSTTEQPNCPILNGSGTNDNINNYAITVNVASNDKRSHTFTYHTFTSFCTGPYLDSNGQCRDNTVDNGTVDAATPSTLTLNRSPTQDAYCGNYQLDLQITSVDGDSNCTYRINNASGVAGVCETGYKCSQGVYTIQGNVFNDLDKNDVKDNGESNYSGGITISSSGGTVSTSKGTYAISGLKAGTYTVSYSNLPSGYYTVYPKNGPPPSFLVKVGPGCTVDGTTGTTCTNGNVTNLNFAISNANPWVQLIDLDGRVDGGFKTTIPASANSQCGAYASIQDNKANNPGIPFSGDTSYDFGQGSASTKNWVVGGAVYPETTSQTTTLKTSYTNLLAIAKHSGLTITDLTTLSTCANLSNCTLPANLPNGIYQAKSDIQLNAYTFLANKSYVFLINGNLTIKGNIIVPTTATALFSTAGNIYIDKGVKATTDACPAPNGQLQGMFSTDRSFTVQGINDCSVGQDTMLNIEGAVIVNAAHTGGTFNNQRDLCADNAFYPSVTMKARPDFLLNAPNILSPQNTYFLESAP